MNSNRLITVAKLGPDSSYALIAPPAGAERDVARYLATSGQPEFEAIRSICCPNDFMDPLAASFFFIVEEMHDDGVPLATSTLLDAMRSRGTFGDSDATKSWLLDLLTDEIGRPAETPAALARYQASLIADKAAKRRIDAVFDDGRLVIRNCRGAAEARNEIVASLNRMQIAERMPTISTAEQVRECVSDVLARKAPPMFITGPSDSLFHRLYIGRRIVTMFGAPSSFGKSALTHQLSFDALRIQGDLKVLFATVEMSPADIVKRQLARLSGVKHHHITEGTFPGAAKDLIADAGEELVALADRFKIVGFKDPFTIDAIERAAEEFDPGIVVVDYLQLLDIEAFKGEERQRLDSLTPRLRALANSGKEGRSVIAISSLHRAGYDRETAGLHSFRGSGSLEYTADAAYLILADENKETGQFENMCLRCCKARNAAKGEWPMSYDGPRLSFTAAPSIQPDDDLAEFAHEHGLGGFYGGQ